MGSALTLKDINEDLLILIFQRNIIQNSTFKLSRNVNLESSLRFNGKVSGHFVSGHVDEVGIIQVLKKKMSKWVAVKSPKNLMKFILKKAQ